jgi:glutamyl-tRNA synthetase
MHIGTARTAYFNWLAARASGGDFTLRIDDTDQKHNDQKSVDVIFDIMEWLGLTYDHVIYQSKNFQLYRDWIAKIPTIEKDGAILLSLDDIPVSDIPLKWHDEIGGDINITAQDVIVADRTVLIRSDGTPTYNWASVVDDITLGIDYILRGTDHITNTSKQVILFHLLNAPLPKFAHVGLIAHKGKLLSKRDGASSMLHYKNAGYEPEAMLNFLARLGWGPKVDDKTTKMLPKERMLELFLAGGNLRSSQANMDLAMLEAYDRRYKAAKGIWRNKDKLMVDNG